MIISVLNHSRGRLKDELVQEVIRAINRQITEDFAPYWSMSAMLRLEGPSSREAARRPESQHPVDMRGDAVLYIWDKAEGEDFLGYHERNYRGIPYGFVFLDICRQLKEPWSVTLSHEALELIADPEVNLLVAGPHPKQRGRTVFHWYEVCDAVQDERYSIDGVPVSNFVLPLYFTAEPEPGARNDFLGRAHRGKTLASFGVNPGGYIGFFDPKEGRDVTYEADARGAKRKKIRFKAREGRRGFRRERLDQGIARRAASATSASAANAGRR